MTRNTLLAGAAVALSLNAPALAADVSEVVVTAAPYAVSMDSATTSIAVVKRDDIDAAPAVGLGDLLSGLPGVRSTFFGLGASRPVIRGLAGPRVVVLTNGVGMIDASALSPDHQVAIDPQEAERIEVLRGPATLAYGGSAIGGVVNIIDGRIPEARVTAPSGRLLASGSSVDDGRAISGAVKLGAGPFAFTLDAAHHRSSDYDVAVPAESRRQLAADGEAFPGPVASTVTNTATHLTAYGAGASYIGEAGFLGLSVKHTKSRYGVPGHVHEHEHEEEEDEEADHGEDAVAIDLKQTRFDLRGGLDFQSGPFESLKITAGQADYEHVELEGGAVGTRFLSNGWEGRLELVQRDRDGWQGALGLQALSRDFDAIGEEALVPATTIQELGVFTLQRLDRDAWGIEGGLRLDRRELDSRVGARSFDNVSASAGAFVRPADGWFLGLSLARSARAPTEEELFSDGAHPATRAYERGDAGLSAEVSQSVDATVHYSAGPWSLDLHAFATRYDGFIDLRPTGEEEDGLPVFAFVQTDATFHGGEAEASFRAWSDGAKSLTLEAAADVVRGQTDLGPPARIPPWSTTARAVFDAGWWNGTLEVRRVGDQDRLADFELATDGYTMLNAGLTFRPLKDRDLKVFLDARNLTDTEAREHASFLKDLAPLPGRNLRVGVGYRF